VAVRRSTVVTESTPVNAISLRNNRLGCKDGQVISYADSASSRITFTYSISRKPMNLVIEFDERLLATIAENNIRRLFQFNEFSSGEFALHVEQATKDAALKILAEINFEDQINESVQTYAHGIIKDVVIKELKKKVKRVIMEMSASGELIVESPHES